MYKDKIQNTNTKVAWHVNANHVGGYSYRLCKLPSGGISELTEECFQQNHLDFVGDHQWVVMDNEPEERKEVLALRTREGTFPPGSHWTKSPLEPEPEETRQLAHIFDYVEVLIIIIVMTIMIIIIVEVPIDLEAGSYVLSFRWDCQATAQIWNACANIEII